MTQLIDRHLLSFFVDVFRLCLWLLILAAIFVPLERLFSLRPQCAFLLGTRWGFFIHANLRWRLGPLEWLISTPAFHHWHHTLAGPVNRNYAPMLPWIDRIFGTLHRPGRQWPAAYGIEGTMAASLGGQLLQPLRQEERVNLA